MFLIGPRRYGKTSILKVAAQRATEDHGAIVLRYDAEAYPRLELLAQRIVADTARTLLGTIERATERAAQFFGRLRPHLTYNTADGTFSASLQVADDVKRAGVPLITDVLDGIERLAATQERSVAVVIDEFQQVVESGGAGGRGAAPLRRAATRPCGVHFRGVEDASPGRDDQRSDAAVVQSRAPPLSRPDPAR